MFVELSPKVEGDFFFADDDPQMQATRAIQQVFPAGAQIIIRAEDRVGDRRAYLSRIEALTADLLVVPGVENAYSIATNDPATATRSKRPNPTPKFTAIMSIAVMS